MGSILFNSFSIKMNKCRLKLTKYLFQIILKPIDFQVLARISGDRTLRKH